MNKIYNGECLEIMSTLPDGCVDMVFVIYPMEQPKMSGMC